MQDITLTQRQRMLIEGVNSTFTKLNLTKLNYTGIIQKSKK